MDQSRVLLNTFCQLLRLTKSSVCGMWKVGSHCLRFSKHPSIECSRKPFIDKVPTLISIWFSIKYESFISKNSRRED